MPVFRLRAIPHCCGWEVGLLSPLDVNHRYRTCEGQREAALVRNGGRTFKVRTDQCGRGSLTATYMQTWPYTQSALETPSRLRVALRHRMGTHNDSLSGNTLCSPNKRARRTYGGQLCS